MRLTREEYQRGVVFWNPSVKAIFRVRASNSPDEETEFSSPLTNPAGSKVDSSPGRYTQLRLDLTPENPMLDTTVPLDFRWEREGDKVISTEVHGHLSEPPTNLAHIPNLGIFHRLVVGTPYLEWQEDIVLRVDDAVVRFVQGTVRGERATAFDRIERTETGVSLTGGGSSEESVDGRFLEIVAPGSTSEDAELKAFAVLGLLGLLVGRQAVGQIVFAERYEATKGRQLGRVEIPVVAQIPREAASGELDLIENALDKLLVHDRQSAVVALALRWYERGLRSRLAIDRLLSFFIGVEVLVNGGTKKRSNDIPGVSKRHVLFERVRAVLKKHDDLLQWLNSQKQRITQPSLSERFEFFSAQLGLGSDSMATFGRMAKARNSLVHGDFGDVKQEDVVDAQHLLEAMLRARLGVPDTAAVRTPQVDRVSVTYELRIQQPHRRPT